MEERYSYEKYDQEQGKTITCPMDDKDGAITGRFILNLPKWFDENPEERKRLGWIKHIEHVRSELPDFDPQTQFIVTSVKSVDEYTVEDVLHVLTKSEDQLAFEEMLSVASWGDGFLFV